MGVMVGCGGVRESVFTPLPHPPCGRAPPPLKGEAVIAIAPAGKAPMERIRAKRKENWGFDSSHIQKSNYRKSEGAAGGRQAPLAFMMETGEKVGTDIISPPHAQNDLHVNHVYQTATHMGRIFPNPAHTL